MSTRNHAPGLDASPSDPRAARGALRLRHYRELFRHTLRRQLILYYLPLLILAAFFLLQYWRMVADHRLNRLEIIAEHQANTLDLFLRERVVNLDNIIDDPSFRGGAVSKATLEAKLRRLQMASDAFIDIGVVDGQGWLLGYHGDDAIHAGVSYGDESWFQELRDGERDWLITDIYLGLRQRPHFTIAVKRRHDAELVILRSAMSPEKITEYLTSLEGANEVMASVVNIAGIFQAATSRSGKPLKDSTYRPPRDPARGHLRQGSTTYAYAWLHQTPWVLVVTDSDSHSVFARMPLGLFGVTLGIFLLAGAVILVRARQVTRSQLEVERTEEELSGQLRHAAKLASVGELAAGIAHEINNPLAIIAEEVGLIQDSLDPDMKDADDEVDVNHSLNVIHDAVFRCRDITRKLLTFVRQTDVCVEIQHPHEILEEVVDGMMSHELTLSNITVVRELDPAVRPFLIDRNQIVQVLVNLVKNAIDAMSAGGTLTIRTEDKADTVVLTVRDTGCGMSPSHLAKVFHPFYTTKDPGKGTGLGLSVSINIIKNLGGDIHAESQLGEGSSFSVVLPYDLK